MWYVFKSTKKNLVEIVLLDNSFRLYIVAVIYINHCIGIKPGICYEKRFLAVMDDGSGAYHSHPLSGFI